MSKICKRIIALLLASCLVAASCPFALASDEEYVAQHRPTVWEHLIDSTGSSMRKLFNSVVGAFVGSDYCAFTDSGKHEGSEVVSKSLGSDGEYTFFIRCTGCGNTFAYRGSDAQQQYNDALHENNLDNGLAVTPEGGLIFRPSIPSNISLGVNLVVPGARYNLSFSPFAEPSGTLARYCVYSATDYIVTVRCLDSSTSLSGFFQSGSFQFVFPVSGTYTTTSYDNATLNDIPLVFDSNSSSAHRSAGNKGNWLLSSPHSFTPTSGVLSFWGPTFTVVPDTPVDVPSVPTTINIDDRDYTVVEIDFSKREVHLEDNRTIIYDDDKITIKEGDTIIDEKNYYIEDDDDPDPGPGDGSSSDPDPGPGDGDSSDPYCNWTPEMWEQLKIMLRQNNSFLEQIYTELVAIEDKVGENGNDYDFSGMYNLIVEIRDALQSIEANPPPDYSQKLEVVANQLANIWGDVQNIKSRLESIEHNTATTNDKLDTVHDDLAAVLEELKEHKGILQQILDTLSKILGHVTVIDENVEEMKDEESSNNFLLTVVNKFGFVNQIYAVTTQMFKDITNDAVTSQDVSNGVIPVGEVTPGHATSYGGEATAPQVLCQFPEISWNGVDFGGYTALDLSWYAPHKPKVDAILSGFFWLSYIYMLFKKLPAIIHGEAMSDD